VPVRTSWVVRVEAMWLPPALAWTDSTAVAVRPAVVATYGSTTSLDPATATVGADTVTAAEVIGRLPLACERGVTEEVAVPSSANARVWSV
jgi:hypothetical protein